MYYTVVIALCYKIAQILTYISGTMHLDCMVA